MAIKTLIGHESKALHQSWIKRLALNMRQKFKYLLEVFDMLKTVQKSSRGRVVTNVHNSALKAFQKVKRAKMQKLLFTRLMLTMS